ncbi:hypothetical protein C8Q74DRAFT_1372926 [Fomes fomentarius]|nr:hypothetical protein C8Q74DRAFT_1372926 [Fomes fomentarius]
MSLPGGTVEASKAKRIERQQARYRDRGGIFKPSEHNPLLELLLSRGVNGESLSRANSPRRSRSRSTSPGKRGHPRPTEVPKPSEAAATSKQQAKRRKSQVAGGRAKKQVIHDTPEEAPTAGSSRLPVASEPTKKGLATKATKKQTRPEAKTKRPSKRKAPDPDPEPTPNLDTSDDEPLAPAARKRAKTKASTAASSKTQASSKKPAATKNAATKGVDHAGDEPAKPRGRGTKKPVKPEPTHEEADEPPPRTKQFAKRVRKTAVEEPDEFNEQPPIKKSAKGKQKAEPPVISDTEGMSLYLYVVGKPSPSMVAKTKAAKAAIGKHRAEDPDESSSDIPLAAFRRPTGRKNPPIAKPKEPPQATKKPSRRHETDAESDRSPSPAPQPPTKRARGPPLTKAKVSRKRAAVEEESSEKADVPKPNVEDVDDEVPRKILGRNRPERDSTARNVDNEARTDVEDDEADENRPRRKKRRPPGDDLSAAHGKSNRANAPGKTGDNHDDVGARKVSRTKAAPVPMPNGVRLKPKPRPRMSMFPAPVLDDEDSDRDPIDCFA